MKIHIRMKVTNKIKRAILYTSRLLFMVMLILFLIETYIPGYSLEHIWLNSFMIVVLVFGAASAILLPYTEWKKPVSSGSVTKIDSVVFIFFGILGALVVWYKIQLMGPLAIVISVLVFPVVLFLLWLMST